MLVENIPPPRVLVVSFAYYPMVGGLPQQARLLSRVLKSQGVDVAVVTIRIDGYPSFDVLDNVPIHRLWTFFGKDAGYRSRVYPWLLPLAVFLIAHRCEYDVIHVHQASYPAAVCVIAGKVLGKPTIIRITGSGSSGNIATLRKWWWLGSLVRLIIRYASCFISLSEDITTELLTEGILPEKIVNIHNGVDTEFYSPVSRQADTSVKIVLGVGRLSEEKGFDILVKAWAKVIDNEPNSRLVIVGDGLDLHMLKTLVRQFGIESTVSFEGNRDNVPDYLANADVFVLPSRNEGMSNALLEAMAMGRACIVSDIPANRSVLTPGVDGLMFKNNDSDDLADRIIQLLQHKHMRAELGIRAREKIITQFSIDTVAKSYIELYSRLVDKGYSKKRVV